MNTQCILINSYIDIKICANETPMAYWWWSILQLSDSKKKHCQQDFAIDTAIIHHKWKYLTLKSITNCNNGLFDLFQKAKSNRSIQDEVYCISIAK